MRKTLRVVTVAAILAAQWFCVQQITAAELAGDAAALELSERMLESLGGREAWAGARTIKVELRGFYARQHKPWTEVFWVDLESPNGRFELRGGDVDRTIAWTPESGWELAEGIVEPIPESRHNVEMEYWLRQPAVIFHRLAKGGSDTRVAIGSDDGRLEIFDAESGDLLAHFAVNLEAEPTKWSTKIGDRDLEHVLGPLETFGNVRFPRWGAGLDGVWRYEHTSIVLSPSPMPVSLDPPPTEENQGSH